MELSKEYIDSLSFTVKKGKYYLGEEVDEALDGIADAANDLNRQLTEAKAKEEKMARLIVRFQATSKEQEAEVQRLVQEKAVLEAELEELKQHSATAEAGWSDLSSRLKAKSTEVTELTEQNAALADQVKALTEQLNAAPAAGAGGVDPALSDEAAKAMRIIAEYHATREALIADLTNLQSKKENLSSNINAITVEAAERIRALAQN